MPGMAFNPLAVSFERCCILIRFSIDLIIVCRASLRRQHNDTRPRIDR